MRITKDHIEAFCRETSVTPLRLAREAGVPPSSVYRLMSGALASLSMANNERIEAVFAARAPHLVRPLSRHPREATS